MVPFPVKALLLSVCSASIISAAEGDRLSIYSGGVSFGGMSMLNAKEKDRAADMYGSVGLNNRFAINDNFDIFADVEFYGFTSTNVAAFSGINGMFGKHKVKPFLGAGAGVSWYDHGIDTTKNAGAGMSVTAHGGVQVDLRDNFAITFTVPYRYTLNDFRDNSIGFQMGLLFSNPHKKIKTIM